MNATENVVSLWQQRSPSIVIIYLVVKSDGR
jgi:hypothetical protein